MYRKIETKFKPWREHKGKRQRGKLVIPTPSKLSFRFILLEVSWVLDHGRFNGFVVSDLTDCRKASARISSARCQQVPPKRSSLRCRSIPKNTPIFRGVDFFHQPQDCFAIIGSFDVEILVTCVSSFIEQHEWLLWSVWDHTLLQLFFDSVETARLFRSESSWIIPVFCWCKFHALSPWSGMLWPELRYPGTSALQVAWLFGRHFFYHKKAKGPQKWCYHHKNATDNCCTQVVPNWEPNTGPKNKKSKWPSGWWSFFFFSWGVSGDKILGEGHIL